MAPESSVFISYSRKDYYFAKRSILGTYRDWSTLIWLFVYAMLWMFVLGFSD